MDVVALYPSIKKDMAAEAVTKAIKNADMEWDRINTEKLIRYVAINTPQRVIKDQGLNDVVPIPEPKTTVRSWITPSGRAKETGGNSQFSVPLRNPTKK